MPRSHLLSMTIVASCALAGCAPVHFMPRPGMAALNQTSDEAGCRLYARNQQTPFVFGAAGSPRFVGASMVGAAIGHGIAEAIETGQNFADCMEVKGYIPVPDQAAPVIVASNAPPPTAAAVSNEPPTVVATATAEAVNPDEITEIRATSINPLMANVLQIPSQKGAYVVGVDRSGQTADGDLQPGDVILEFGSARISGLDDLERQMSQTHTHTTVRTRVRRDETIRVVMARF